MEKRSNQDRGHVMRDRTPWGMAALALIILASSSAVVVAQPASEAQIRTDPSLGGGGVPQIPGIPSGPQTGGPATAPVTTGIPGVAGMAQPVAPGVPPIPRADPGMAIPAIPAAPMAAPLNTL